ncbi:hypothetical protein [Allomesorhizobium camelthorni]|uniref:Uncharacterized protein n=1 Tax=Allomesorhizobium camelthorni TaxID=475069 RepID=A0A6G4W6Q4_9HYPH|nr:hypothetical protein [Mesorhizobium camelthorni]NGO50435.1 hypothetical protein [Mesorhizobium camelthorni]
MHVIRKVVDILTATDGGATEYSPPLTGRLVEVIYTKDASNALASTADFTVTTERDGQAVWNGVNVNASTSVRPVRAGSTVSGAASTLTEVPLHLADDRVKFVVAQGGNAKAGRFTVITI